MLKFQVFTLIAGEGLINWQIGAKKFEFKTKTFIETNETKRYELFYIKLLLANLFGTVCLFHIEPEVLFWYYDTTQLKFRKMVMTSLIRLIAKVFKWQTFFQKGKQFGLISPVWGCNHERQFNKHVHNSKKKYTTMEKWVKENHSSDWKRTTRPFAPLHWVCWTLWIKKIIRRIPW